MENHPEINVQKKAGASDAETPGIKIIDIITNSY